MSGLQETGPFRFETSYHTEEVRPGRRSERSRIGPTEDQFFIGFALFGIVCLFWRYTAALGAVTLVLTTFLWAMRERARSTRKRFEHLEMPDEVVNVVLTEAGYSLHGDGFSAQTTWDHFINAMEMDGRLLLQSWHMPRVFVSIEEMRRAGVYERVQSIVGPRTESRKAAYAEAAKAQS